MVKKTTRLLFSAIKQRGILVTLLMSWQNIIDISRGLFLKLIYFGNLKSGLFFIQKGSSIEIFNKHARVILGKHVYIRKNCSFRVIDDGFLQLSDRVFINDGCVINCAEKIVIGERTKIAPQVCINDHDHNYRKKTSSHLLKQEVVIGKNVWIGSHVVILMGATIGDNAVIGAGTIVRGHVPPNTLFVNKRQENFIPFDPPPEPS